MTKFMTISALLAALSLSSAQAQDYSLSASVGWESSYIFRGVQFAEENFVSSVDFGMDDFYLGFWSMNPTAGASNEGGVIANEVNFYGGYGIALSDTISLDVGGVLYYFPEVTEGDQTTFETWIGASFDTLLAPSIYLYYDWDLENITFEGSIGYSIEVAESTALELGAFIGWVALDSDLEAVIDGETVTEDSYVYIGASADFVYTINETASTSFGVRYSYNTEDDFDGNDDEFWFGGSVAFGF